MRWSSKRRLRFALPLTLFAIAAFSLVPTTAWAQGETTSAILGQVADSSSAVVPAATVTVVNRETGLKRTAKTTIVVKSGETVVIGGMIQDDSSKGTGKVPLLGDIPLLGWLFKTRSTTNTRTNLFVFITPRIIEQPEDARKIQEEKMDYMRTIQEGTIRTAPQKKTEAKEKE